MATSIIPSQNLHFKVSFTLKKIGIFFYKHIHLCTKMGLHMLLFPTIFFWKQIRNESNIRILLTWNCDINNTKTHNTCVRKQLIANDSWGLLCPKSDTILRKYGTLQWTIGKIYVRKMSLNHCTRYNTAIRRTGLLDQGVCAQTCAKDGDGV
jgi:hypothetical protein